MRYLFLVLFSCLLQYSKAQTSTTNFQDITLTTTIDSEGKFNYSLYYKNKPVIYPAKIGFELNKPKMVLNEFILVSIDSNEINNTWKPIWGEEDEIKNNYKQLIFHLKDKKDSEILLDIEFRLFSDGIGFRYMLPKQKNLTHFIIGNELTEFKMSGDHKAFWIPGDYDTNEYSYNTTKLSAIESIVAAGKEKDIAVVSLIGPTSVQTPLMMKSQNGLYINIHEAALIDYPVMNLTLNKQDFVFTTALVPDPVGNKAYLETPARTPWRTILVSDVAADLLSSKTILNLNEPSSVQNTDWIKPQKFMGVWWEMHIGKATWQKEGGKHGATTANAKRYIDFAAAHKIDGVLVEGWNKGWEDWFGNWKENVYDFVTPYPDYNIQEVSNYAKEKGVNLIMHHETAGAVTNYERRLDTAYKFMLSNNIYTVKTGYVGKIIPRGEHHDGQWMVNHFNRVAEKTAQYQIMLEAHESVHPTGLHRTYPNWMANEAARGAEFNNAPTLGITPEHNTILPFTRLMGGPMDYTPGLFHFKLNQFDSTRTQVVRSTLAKQLALYVTMYSPLQMLADLPENYEKHLDAFQFIKDVPVDWSATKIIEAEPGDYITIARRAKNSKDWFMGSITDENERISTIRFDFLEANKKYEATIYKDGTNADYINNPSAYIIEKKQIDTSSTLNIRLAKGGGYAISIKQK
ncbi:MAG: hypothetical protein RL713_635 [Bacteroidota bacterium]